MAKAPFGRLVRFKNQAGSIFFGEVPGTQSVTEESLNGSSVSVYDGEAPWDHDFCLSDRREEIHEVCERLNDSDAAEADRMVMPYQVLSPLPEVPGFYGVGLNYRAHATEANVWLSTRQSRAIFLTLELATHWPLSRDLHQASR